MLRERLQLVLTNALSYVLFTVSLKLSCLICQYQQCNSQNGIVTNTVMMIDDNNINAADDDLL